ncbi:uncharacterized protein LOC132628710 [Lycium barbarum]|uniref:uncharacterized protein LOC132628710 n=1 Tax=Lycium barbarum TaxID=112863 RepID=UPI00293E25A9|nr:uncharacterized protein LOC132628710 [Lycium barbarum]
MPTFFSQESLFSLASAIGIPLHLDKATENRTRPSYARVKVLLDLLSDLPSYVNMEIEDDETQGVRVDKELPQNPIPEKKRKNQHNNRRRFNARLLVSGKLLGDPGNWNVVKDNRVFDEPPSTSTNETTQKQSQQADDIVTHNKFDALQEEEQAIEVINADSVVQNEEPKETEAIVEDSSVVVNNGKEATTLVKGSNSGGLTEIPQDQQVTKIRGNSPMRELHDLVSHNIVELEVGSDTVGKKAEDISCLDDEEAIATVLNQVIKEADLSPKSQVKVRTQKAFHRVQMLHRHHKFFLIAFMEPFQHLRHIDQYRRKIGMQYAKDNCNGKIWFFVNENIDMEILEDTAQQITVKLFFQELHKNMVVTMVYAMCDEVERVNLWDCLCNISATMSVPWLIGGDFNEYEDFACCVNSCELFEVNFKGNPFTWWNGRTNGECIFKRLDRILVNDPFQSWFCQIEVDHLSRTGSDHAPLLLSCTDKTQTFLKTFKFLKFWTEHANFPEVVRQHWQGDSADVFLAFKQKLKSVKSALSQWSKYTFGDIFKLLSIREEIVRIKEDLFEEFPTEEGDRNTRFFHNIVKGRRKRTQIKRIKNSDGTWIEGTDNLADEEDNDLFCSIPSLEEVRQVVFELAGDSASGPDGLSGLFYQSCWNIVSVDVHMVVKAYFEGHTLPKSITHTNLVLLPKKNEVETFSDMRPISLSNFINKIISRVLHENIDHFLPKLISVNQSGFVKGRNIIKNVLLTQEIVSDIRLRGKPANVVLKLDMTKAYDRVSWLFLTKVLRKMVFAERSVDLVWRLLANTVYSVLVNGHPHGFFHSTRGVKQGDPLSPALFISSAEEYEKVFGQLINKRKSSFYIFSKVSQNIVQGVEKTTGFSRGSFPFVYLGCPISHARKRKTDYSELIKKVKDKLQAWKERLLSPGGKVVLILSVLQSVPIHLLSAMKPLKCVIKEIYQNFAKFFWSNKEDVKSRHWAAWLNMSFPKEVGGLGFRSLFDVSKTLCAKLWWNFRTSNSLWANYLWNKYCKRQYPQYVQWKGGTQVWKIMLEARDSIEQEIWWETKSGTANVWFYNWTRLGALYYTLPDQDVDESVEDETIDHLFLNGEVAQYIWKVFSSAASIQKNCSQFGPSLKYTTVTWRVPASGWYKCNSDGALRGNPGPSPVAFCIRDDNGDLVMQQLKRLQMGKIWLLKLWPSSKEFSTQQFNTFQELPSMARKLLKIDKAQIPNLRIRYASNTRSSN